MVSKFLNTGRNAGQDSPPTKPKASQSKKTNKDLIEANRKMNTMLEETLMKNIQLQNLVEALSPDTAKRKSTEGTDADNNATNV
eukprot:m.86528 g.86528  ORF g.86528 m.86528 type:complete len:84 (+) comp13060_c0_seq4:2119-2370(+)